MLNTFVTPEWIADYRQRDLRLATLGVALLESIRRLPSRARAWLVLTMALALHVVDEASNDFLTSFYNPMVLRMRERFDWLPMPTFTFWPWLIGLTIAVLLLFALVPSVARGGRWVKALGYPFAVLMLLNGIGHIAFSIMEGKMVAGVWTAPLLLAASIYLFAAIIKSGSTDRHGQVADKRRQL